LRGAPPPDDNDLLTVAAIAIIAICVVTFDHEALGHGSACLLLHGHIRLLTSSLFHCDTRSGWIDPAGPVSNLLIGTLALLSLRSVPARWLKLRLGLILVTAFSFFWEGAYLIRAMLKRDGDLYFFAEFILGEISALQRCAAVAGGIVLYIFAARITVAAFATLWSSPEISRAVARTVWFSATMGAALAALAYTGHGWGNFKDAVLEIGGASIPLLLMQFNRNRRDVDRPSVVIARSPITIAMSIAIYGAFVISLGRGIGF
jgi:hypothetical protein